MIMFQIKRWRSSYKDDKGDYHRIDGFVDDKHKDKKNLRSYVDSPGYFYSYSITPYLLGNNYVCQAAGDVI